MCSLWIVYYKDKFIIAIDFFFIILAVFRFILNKLPLNDIKYQLCYLKGRNFSLRKSPSKLKSIQLKRCLYTQKFYLFIVTRFFLLLLVLFLCLLKIVYYCLWGINEFVVFLCIVHVWFWFFIILPRFLLLVIKGQFFPRTNILFQSAFVFSRTKM